MGKSKWKKQVKKKRKSIEERAKEELINNILISDKRIGERRKKYLQKCDNDKIRGVIYIKLHMQQVNCNYKRDNADTNSHYVKNQKKPQSMC